MTKMLWKNQKNDKHFWAFYYYCKKQGDKVFVHNNVDGTLNLLVIKDD